MRQPTSFTLSRVLSKLDNYQANQPGTYLGSAQAIILDIAPSHRGKVVYLCYLMFIQPYVDSDHVYQPGEGLPGVFSLDAAGQVHLGTDVFDANQNTPRKPNQRIDLLSDLSNEELALPGTFQVTPAPRILMLDRGARPEFSPGDLLFWSNNSQDESRVLSQVLQKMTDLPQPWYLISTQTIAGQQLGQSYFSVINNYPVTSPDGLNPQRAPSSTLHYIPVTPSPNKALQEMTKAHRLPVNEIETLFGQQQAIERSRQWPGC